jgi:hypothetical protein
MTYSDGLELMRSNQEFNVEESMGPSWSSSTHKIHLQLRSNEHVVAVESHKTGNFEFSLASVRFLTNKNRWLEALGLPMAGGRTRQYSTVFETGEILHRLEWSPTSTTLISYSTVPLTQIVHVAVDESGMIPTLQKLAYEAIHCNFKNQAIDIEQNAKARGRTMAKNVSARMHRLAYKYQQTLQNSHEASFYRLISSLVPKAKAKLDSHAKQLQYAVEDMLDDMRTQAESDLDESRREYASAQVSVIRQHGQLLSRCADLSVIPHGERQTLCFTPACRKLFHYSKVAIHKRCAQLHCSFEFPNCGCSILQSVIIVT